MSVTECVRTIALNRPEVLNAFDLTMLRELRAAIGSAVSDAAVRTIVLTGGARAFSTGEDLRAAQTLDAAGFREQIEELQKLAGELRDAPKRSRTGRQRTPTSIDPLRRSPQPSLEPLPPGEGKGRQCDDCQRPSRSSLDRLSLQQLICLRCSRKCRHSVKAACALIACFARDARASQEPSGPVAARPTGASSQRLPA